MYGFDTWHLHSQTHYMLFVYAVVHYPFCAYGITIIVLEVNIIFSLNLNQVLRKHMLCVVSCHCNFNLMIFNYNILLLLLLLLLLLPPPLLLLLLLPPQLLQLLRLLVAVNMSAMSYSQHVLLGSQLELVCKNL